MHRTLPLSSFAQLSPLSLAQHLPQRLFAPHAPSLPWVHATHRACCRARLRRIRFRYHTRPRLACRLAPTAQTAFAAARVRSVPVPQASALHSRLRMRRTTHSYVLHPRTRTHRIRHLRRSHVHYCGGRTHYARRLTLHSYTPHSLLPAHGVTHLIARVCTNRLRRACDCTRAPLALCPPVLASPATHRTRYARTCYASRSPRAALSLTQ